MCSRFELNTPPRELARRFGLKAPPPAPNAAEIRPTDQALVVGRVSGEAEARLLAWDLAVSWDAKPLINARAETLAEKRTFRPLLEKRCLVPATAWFEWRKAGRAKLKNRITPAGGGTFAFAGLTDGERFTIVTCGAAPAVAGIHHRMPVVLDAAAEGSWIDPAVPFTEVKSFLVSYAGDLEAVEAPPPGEGRAGHSDLFGR